MKIMIDTKHDSQDDIRKVIELLSTLVKKETAIFEPPAIPDGLMGMFDAGSQTVTVPAKIDEPRIELY